MHTGELFTVLALSALLTGCVQASGDLSPDFGVATSRTLAAQTADPDAVYRRQDPPAASGPRSAGAQDRYNRGQERPLPNRGASDVGSAAASSESPGASR